MTNLLVKIKFKIKRLSIRLPIAFKFILSSFFVFIIHLSLKQKIKGLPSQFSLTYAFSKTFCELLKVGDPGKTKIKFCSLPVSSEINTPFTYTADSYLLFQWHEVFLVKRYQENNTSLFICYFGCCLSLCAELMIKRGFYTIGFVIYQWLSKSSNKVLQAMGYVGLLDLSVLFFKWNNQLKSYREGGIWLDLDKQKNYSDELTPLFKMGNKNRIETIYQTLTALQPHNTIGKLIYSEYLTTSYQLERCLIVLEESNKTLKSTLTIQRIDSLLQLLNEDDFENKSDLNLIAEIKTLTDACREQEFLCEPIANAETVSHYFDYYYQTSSQKIERKQDSFHIDFDTQYLSTIKNAYIYGDMVGYEKNNSMAIIKESHPFELSSFKMFNWFVNLYNTQKALLLKREAVEYESAYFISGRGRNYYHWLVEIVPLLVIYKKYSLNVPIYFSFELTSWHKETLVMLELDKIKIIPLPQGKINSFKTLYLPSIPSRNTLSSSLSIEAVRSALAKPKAIEKGKKVFLKREAINGVRKTKGMGTIEKHLLMVGFESVEPSQMSIKEQIDFFADVEVIIAEGGAVFANLLFAPKKVRVLCLTSDRSLFMSFTSIAVTLEQKIDYAVSASRVIPSAYYIWNAPNVVSNLKMIKNWLYENV